VRIFREYIKADLSAVPSAGAGDCNAGGKWAQSNCLGEAMAIAFEREVWEQPQQRQAHSRESAQTASRSVL
jgi:hypothetical protein